MFSVFPHTCQTITAITNALKISCLSTSPIVTVGKYITFLNFWGPDKIFPGCRKIVTTSLMVLGLLVYVHCTASSRGPKMLLKVDCLPNAVGKQPSIPLIDLGRKWTLSWWWWWHWRRYKFSQPSQVCQIEVHQPFLFIFTEFFKISYLFTKHHSSDVPASKSSPKFSSACKLSSSGMQRISVELHCNYASTYRYRRWQPTFQYRPLVLECSVDVRSRSQQADLPAMRTVKHQMYKSKWSKNNSTTQHFSSLIYFNNTISLKVNN